MSNIVDIRDFQSDYITKSIGSGLTADCFLTKDNHVFKRFKSDIQSNFEYTSKALSEFHSDSITFPETLVYLDKKFIGYIKEYASGVCIDTLEDSVNIKRMIEALKELEEDANELYERLSFIDLSGENIVYDSLSNKMKIIDTDFFQRVEDGIYYRGKSKIFTYLDNRRWISQSFDSFTRDCDNISLRIKQLMTESILYGLTSPSRMLLGIISELEKLTNKEIQTIKDYKDSIKLVKGR